jgi:hypothetical protein
MIPPGPSRRNHVVSPPAANDPATATVVGGDGGVPARAGGEYGHRDSRRSGRDLLLLRRLKPRATGADTSEVMNVWQQPSDSPNSEMHYQGEHARRVARVVIVIWTVALLWPAQTTPRRAAKTIARAAPERSF